MIVLCIAMWFHTWGYYEVIDYDSTMYGENVYAEKTYCEGHWWGHHTGMVTAREYLFIDESGELQNDRVVFKKNQLKKIKP